MEISENNDCAICGLDLNEKFQIKLSCNHIFHYECLLKTFTQNIKYESYSNNYKNKCPYCRSKVGVLPVVNGLKSVQLDIHYKIYDKKPEPICIPCKAILKKGKNKNNPCNKKCQLGLEYCGLHKNYK